MQDVAGREELRGGHHRDAGVSEGTPQRHDVVVSSQATEFYIQATVAMACAERLSSFDSIESEEAGAMYQAPPDDWPSAGAIQLSDLKARYRTNTPLVLQGINIEIKPGEKIGFVGRTGSGKSSMLLALYRMLL